MGERMECRQSQRLRPGRQELGGLQAARRRAARLCRLRRQQGQGVASATSASTLFCNSILTRRASQATQATSRTRRYASLTDAKAKFGVPNPALIVSSLSAPAKSFNEHGGSSWGWRSPYRLLLLALPQKHLLDHLSQRQRLTSQ